MRITTLTTLAIAFAFAAGCDSGPAAPETGPGPVSLERVNVNDRIPISGTTVNSCPLAEPIAYEGWAHIVQHGNVEPGSEDVKTHVNLHATGVGLVTGAKYELLQNTKDEFVFTATPYGFEGENTTYTRFIRQGSEDNFFAIARLHIVCDAAGCRILENSFETECRG